jgi:hypothetical protein
MFTIRPSHSDGCSRRSFLLIGVAGLGALSLPRLLRGDEPAVAMWDSSIRRPRPIWFSKAAERNGETCIL